MTLGEMKGKALALIEEASPENPALTADGDLSAKLVPVINQIMYELARMKKRPQFIELPVKAGDTVTFADLEAACGLEIYQLSVVSGVGYIPRAEGTVLQILSSGNMQIECFVYPERITEKTPDSFELELSPDALEIMPYGIAADLLKSDPSADYGKVYAQRYENLLLRLDRRYRVGGIYIEGGI